MTAAPAAVRFQLPQNEIIRQVAVRSLMPSQAEQSKELDALLALAKMVFKVPFAAVTIIDEDWQHIAAVAGIAMSGCSREQSMCTHVVHSGRPFVISDLSAEAEFHNLPYVLDEPKLRFYAGAPVDLEPGVTVGAVCIFDDKPRHLSAEDIDTLSNFGTVAGGLLRLQRSNILLRREESVLKTAAITDPLTGFFNRSVLGSLVDGAIRQAMTQGEEIGVLYMDMDGFKAINDRYGHGFGDAVLVEAARRIRSVIRAEDLPVRLGGDEFAIFLSARPNAAAFEAVAERLVVAFRAPFEIDGHSVNGRTSIGVVTAPQDGRTREELARKVDMALYEAKGRGRDRYVCFDPALLGKVS
jgi:diguanylate cyclase (GGDEF)-like protein